MLTPLDPKQWTPAMAAHLLNRTGFGGTPEQIDALHKAGLDGAVSQLLNGSDDSAQFPKPDGIAPRNLLEERQQVQSLPPEERKMRVQMVQKEERQSTMGLVMWWLERMRNTPNPAREK